jgi:hypothetical protein
MNTRTFLKSLIVAAVAPQILIPRAPTPYKWVRTTKIALAGGLMVPNPEWFKAAYELGISSSIDPIRFKLVGGDWVLVPKYMWVEA